MRDELDSRRYSSISQTQWENKEKMIQEFANFEEQVNQFDVEINDLLFGNSRQCNRLPKDHTVSDDDINMLLQKIQTKESIQQQQDGNIDDILKDIENEFKEIDEIMSEVEGISVNYENSNIAPGV